MSESPEIAPNGNHEKMPPIGLQVTRIGASALRHEHDKSVCGYLSFFRLRSPGYMYDQPHSVYVDGDNGFVIDPEKTSEQFNEEPSVTEFLGLLTEINQEIGDARIFRCGFSAADIKLAARTGSYEDEEQIMRLLKIQISEKRTAIFGVIDANGLEPPRHEKLSMITEEVAAAAMREALKEVVGESASKDSVVTSPDKTQSIALPEDKNLQKNDEMPEQQRQPVKRKRRGTGVKRGAPAPNSETPLSRDALRDRQTEIDRKEQAIRSGKGFY